jgi:hypothetical protein
MLLTSEYDSSGEVGRRRAGGCSGTSRMRLQVRVGLWHVLYLYIVRFEDCSVLLEVLEGEVRKG